MSAHVVPVKTYLGVFVALLALTALTTGVAFIDFGELHTGIRLLDMIPLNTVAALAIAVAKMLLVILFFMHVKYSSGLTKIVVLAGFFFLAILVALTLSDELTRGWSPEPTGWGAIIGTILPSISALLRGLF
ncbi:MAG: cytochrome C oxidase subunit IV family protein [Candidatus Acidiferrales bacterium]